MPPAQEDPFLCLACGPGEEVARLATFPLLQQHFLAQHGVADLLAGPATLAVRLPRSLATHACLLCQWQGEGEVRSHLATVHGEFFSEGWAEYSSVVCRVCGEEVAGEEDRV